MLSLIRQTVIKMYGNTNIIPDKPAFFATALKNAHKTVKVFHAKIQVSRARRLKCIVYQYSLD